MATIKRCLEVTPRQHSPVTHSAVVMEIAGKLKEEPENGELWMEHGLALSRQMLHREAVESLSRAIITDPFRGIYYRHRGHRFLSCHRFEDACADFTIASRLIPENWDVWYHLGLSWFLLGDYKQALIAYKHCAEMSHSDDKLIAIADWLWITYKRLGMDGEAAQLLKQITPEMDPGENTAYFGRLLMYKGLRQPEELLSTLDNAVNIITAGFGLANFFFLRGDQEKAEELLRQVIQRGDENDLYYAFGYLAAMVDLERLFAS